MRKLTNGNAALYVASSVVFGAALYGAEQLLRLASVIGFVSDEMSCGYVFVEPPAVFTDDSYATTPCATALSVFAVDSAFRAARNSMKLGVVAVARMAIRPAATATSTSVNPERRLTGPSAPRPLRSTRASRRPDRRAGRRSVSRTPRPRRSSRS